VAPRSLGRAVALVESAPGVLSESWRPRRVRRRPAGPSSRRVRPERGSAASVVETEGDPAATSTAACSVGSREKREQAHKQKSTDTTTAAAPQRGEGPSRSPALVAFSRIQRRLPHYLVAGDRSSIRESSRASATESRTSGRSGRDLVDPVPSRSEEALWPATRHHRHQRTPRDRSGVHYLEGEGTSTIQLYLCSRAHRGRSSMRLRGLRPSIRRAAESLYGEDSPRLRSCSPRPP